MTDGQYLAAQKERLKKSGFLTAKVGSDSMKPWLLKGEDIVVALKPVEELRMFDPVVFWNGKDLIVHLFLRFNRFKDANGELMILTQGLDIFIPDQSVSASAILGVVQKKKPWWLGPYMLWVRWRGHR